MPDQTSENQTFKVVDRRTFTSEGTRREEAAPREEKPAPEPKKELGKKGAEDRVDDGFAMLLEFLANSAFLQMGLGAGPSGESIPVDLEGARAMIDLLGVVQDKTKGNLSSAEQKLLSNLLFEMHTRFVEIQRPPAAKRR